MDNRFYFRQLLAGRDIAVGDPIDLSDLAGRPADASTLAEGTERLMDAITDLEAALRGETPPATRMLFRRHPDGPGPVAPDHPAS